MVRGRKKSRAPKKRKARKKKSTGAKKRGGGRKAAGAKPKAKKKKRKSPSAFNRKWYPSDQLEVVVGAKPISRPQAVKKLWAYIKRHKLQDPSDKRMIVPDDVLADIFGDRPFSMFEMNSLLTEHFFAS